jgi:ribosomal biogenesis protein LAS1
MSLGRAVPWFAWEEWDQVEGWLFSGDAAAVARGLDRVAAWRGRGRLPLGADATAALLATARAEAAAPPLAELGARLQYAMALVRLVNGVADSSQRGRVAASVAALAAGAGLPRSLVDLRHEATHNELPTAAAARRAAGEALAWLRAGYWRRQAEHRAAELARVAAGVAAFVGSHREAAGKAAAARCARPGSDDEEGGGAGIGPEYDAAGARRRRQALLTELRAAVPRPAAALLVPPLLAAARGEERGAGGGYSGDGAGAITATALRRALDHLRAPWPQLPPLLLRAAARALCAAARGEAGAAAGVAAAAAWAALLLDPAPPHGDGGGAAAAPWAPSAEQAGAILGEALPALAAAARRGRGSAPAAAALEALAAALAPLLAPERRARAEALLAGIRAAAGGGAATEEPIAEEPAPAPAAAARAKRPAEAPAGTGSGEAPRWRRVAGWRACAVGMLPCRFDPNGELPQLDLEAPAGAFAAAAEEAAGGGSEDGWEAVPPLPLAPPAEGGGAPAAAPGAARAPAPTLVAAARLLI